MLGEAPENHNLIANLLAKKFIARSDLKAIQRDDGSYMPRRQPFSRDDLLQHIRGEVTYGHYLLNTDNQVKVIVFDIDLDKVGYLPTLYTLDEGYHAFEVHGCQKTPCTEPGCKHLMSPRAIWRSRGHGPDSPIIMQRSYMSGQLRSMAEKLMRAASHALQVPVTMAYTGSKGVHVYAFTGLTDADLARIGIDLTFETALGSFEKFKGQNFFKMIQTGDHEEEFSALTVEVFPKQTEIGENGLGNLVRLPLGINRHNPSHPCFFMDARASHGRGAITRRDALDALQAANPWAGAAPDPA